MPIQLVGNRLKVYEYLKKISPQWATYEDIEKAVEIHPTQQVFLIINLLKSSGLIVAENSHFRENEWAFSVQPSQSYGASQIPPRKTALNDRLEVIKDALPEDNLQTVFRRLAEVVMSRQYGIVLHNGVPTGIPQVFDLVSDHGEVAGDTQYFTQIQEESQLPAKFAAIAEQVWLLEKTRAKRKFLVFGNQREVAVEWLSRFGHLLGNVAFYYLAGNGELEVLKAVNDNAQLPGSTVNV